MTLLIQNALRLTLKFVVQQKFEFNELNSIKKSHWSISLPKYANYFIEFFEIFSEEFKVKIAVLMSMFGLFIQMSIPKLWICIVVTCAVDNLDKTYFMCILESF